MIFNTEQYSRPNPTQYPGYYQIQKLTINGQSFIEQMIQLDIYEDIFNETMTGSITIVDTENLIKSIPIVGEEEIELEIDDQIKEIKMKFLVYKITNRAQTNYGVLSYIIHFCSKERYVNEFTRVSKAYDDVLYETAVKDIMKNSIKTDKKLMLGESKYKQCFVIPNWAPLGAIKWMGSRTIDKNDNYSPGNFLFFENREGFNFVSLENLFDQSLNVPYATVSIDPMRPSEEKKAVYDKRMLEDTMRFEDYKVSKSFNILEQSSNGMYKNWLKLVDIMERKGIDYKYDYLEEFEKSMHLDGALGDEFPVASKNHLAFKSEDKIEKRTAIIHRALFTNEQPGGYHFDEWYLPRISQIEQADNFKIEGTLPGELGLKAGMSLYFDFPNIENLSIGNSQRQDVYYSGNYLVTSIRRVFQKNNKFWNNIEMIKDNLSLSLDNIST